MWRQECAKRGAALALCVALGAGCGVVGETGDSGSGAGDEERQSLALGVVPEGCPAPVYPSYSERACTARVQLDGSDTARRYVYTDGRLRPTINSTYSGKTRNLVQIAYASSYGYRKDHAIGIITSPYGGSSYTYYQFDYSMKWEGGRAYLVESLTAWHNGCPAIATQGEMLKDFAENWYYGFQPIYSNLARRVTFDGDTLLYDRKAQTSVNDWTGTARKVSFVRQGTETPRSLLTQQLDDSYYGALQGYFGISTADGPAEVRPTYYLQNDRKEAVNGYWFLFERRGCHEAQPSGDGWPGQCIGPMFTVTIRENQQALQGNRTCDELLTDSPDFAACGDSPLDGFCVEQGLQVKPAEDCQNTMGVTGCFDSLETRF